MCRKAHGSAFASMLRVREAAFQWARRGSVITYESSPGTRRPFCTTCGSPLPQDPTPKGVFLPAGPLEGDPGTRPAAHIFTASRAPWYEIEDALPCFESYPPGYAAPGAVVPPTPAAPAAGGVRGSCLCGRVRYRITAKPLLAQHCHCSRCRRARGAAHASNLFVAADGLRFDSGEEAVETFRVPEARRFGHSFCRYCGASVPRVDRSEGIVGVPMGSLDDDPGIRPLRHIYTGSKAAWFEIPGSLPQCAEGAPG